MFVLRLNCEDRPGIVAAVATVLSNNQCNIEEAAHFFDPLSGQFFMRVVYRPLQEGCGESFAARFEEIARDFEMKYRICDLSQPVRMAVMVSRFDHCLNDLLYRWRTRTLPVEITCVISNHKDAEKLVSDHGLPFHVLPVEAKTKAEQEENVAQILQQTETELIVLARYMQVLSEDFCTKNKGRIINIHHSFLPGFKGAKPYTQAYERGVKIIGATAHFVTPDLDEGPIIAQGVQDVTHADTPAMMQAKGRDTESRVLARAIELYAQRRIFLQGQRTIIL